MAAEKWTAGQIPSQTGKTALVTGANSGIGYQTVLELARHGAHVILGSRDATKGQAALAKLQHEAPGASAELALFDVASLASIHAFADPFVASGRTLDILVNNAGVMALPKRELTPDGFERQFGTNHLGHFALTGLLMPALLKSPAPRVVTVSSMAHRGGKLEWDNLQGERKYVPWNSYNNSKLANILFARELDHRVRAAGSKLTSIAVHPGVVRTSIVQNGPGSGDLKTFVLFRFFGFLTQDDCHGALPTLYAATSPDAQGGQYIGPDGIFMGFSGYPTVTQPKPQALDDAVGKRLWSVSEQLTGVSYPL